MSYAAEAPRILVIDDNSAIHNDFRKTLLGVAPPASAALTSAKAALFGDKPAPRPAETRPRFELVSAMQGEEGLSQIQASVRDERPFNVAFVDMRMPPGWDGVQTIQRMWEADPNVEVVICTAYSDYSWQEISRKLGLTDRLLILKKPFEPVEITQIAISLSEKWALKRKVEMKMGELERLVHERTAELVHAALHDKLTGLPNRALARDRIAQAVERRKRNPGYHFATLFLDFDQFKRINDSYGHQVGDELLVQISQRLTRSLRGNDAVCAGRDGFAASRDGFAASRDASADSVDGSGTSSDASIAARLGGDEFVILLDDLRSPDDAARVGERILQALAEPYALGGCVVVSSASVGITTSAIDYQNADDMLRDADAAMYHAKAAGKARCALFDHRMHEQVRARLETETGLRDAIAQGQFVLHYQPVVSMTDGVVVGFEALLRWRHPTRGLILPGEFIECAEDTGLIVPIGSWVLAEACRQLAGWHVGSDAGARLFMCVNVSARQIAAPGFADEVRSALARTNVDPHRLVLEITETTMIRDPDAANPVFNELTSLGVKLYMDDFGTGYSSLSCLHRFPLSGLKIDRSFVNFAAASRDDAAIVHAIASLAHNLGMSLVAEGVETADQVVLLQAMDCDEGQGYYFSKPLEAAAAQAYLLAPLKPALLPGAAADRS